MVLCRFLLLSIFHVPPHPHTLLPPPRVGWAPPWSLAWWDWKLGSSWTRSAQLCVIARLGRPSCTAWIRKQTRLSSAHMMLSQVILRCSADSPFCPEEKTLPSFALWLWESEPGSNGLDLRRWPLAHSPPILSVSADYGCRYLGSPLNICTAVPSFSMTPWPHVLAAATGSWVGCSVGKSRLWIFLVDMTSQPLIATLSSLLALHWLLMITKQFIIFLYTLINHFYTETEN